MVLGIEVFIFTTAYSTTLFVSKADSTGYLHLLNLPKGAPSPIREVCAAFIQYLVEHRKRKKLQFVVSLFARAQGQYLFPRSVDHGAKHVLDDRGLIKWWCRVLDPLMPSPHAPSVRGYLVVPGLDAYETRAFLPRGVVTSSSSDKSSSRWSLGHPLEKISHYCREFDWVPPRCLIPCFPDDPKSRFRDELDDEAARSRAMRLTGSWKSVKTLDVFWDMMAYRQECSSGRMTGFIWVVFDDHVENPPLGQAPAPSLSSPPRTPEKQQRLRTITTPSTTPRKLFPSKPDGSSTDKQHDATKTTMKRKKKKIKLRGPIRPRQPKIKSVQRNFVPKMPIRTAYYSWPPEGRGERIVNETTYKRINELMLHTDFSTLDKAVGSSRRWINEVGIGNKWGKTVVGERDIPASQPEHGSQDVAAAVKSIPPGLIKRKRADSLEQKGGQVNILSAGIVKKKTREDQSLADGAREVNTLASNLVRKKPKT